VPPSSVYPDLVKLAGGPDPISQLALERLQAGKPVEALHLTDIALSSDPQNAAALNVRIKAFENLREKCENAVEDGWLQYGIRKAKETLAAK
jgi:alkyl sulfatase BDS1-like metallo-beta-lactamase superfamily hydrolase